MNYAHKYDNLDEMAQFLKGNLLKLTEEEIAERQELRNEYIAYFRSEIRKGKSSEGEK